MTPQTRKLAAETGARTYNTGRPCNSGHTADRYTSTGHCTECLRLRRTDFAVTIRETRRPTDNGARIFTYRLHPEDHAAALAFCQALDLQRGRTPRTGQAVVAPEPPRSATAEEVAAHRARILGANAELNPAPARHMSEEMRRHMVAEGYIK